VFACVERKRETRERAKAFVPVPACARMHTHIHKELDCQEEVVNLSDTWSGKGNPIIFRLQVVYTHIDIYISTLNDINVCSFTGRVFQHSKCERL